jgi:hypothetical protein
VTPTQVKAFEREGGEILEGPMTSQEFRRAEEFERIGKGGEVRAPQSTNAHITKLPPLSKNS